MPPSPFPSLPSYPWKHLSPLPTTTWHSPTPHQHYNNSFKSHRDSSMCLSFITLLHFRKVFVHLNKPIQNGGSDMITSFLVNYFKETWIDNFETEISNCLSKRTQSNEANDYCISRPTKFQNISTNRSSDKTYFVKVIKSKREITSRLRNLFAYVDLPNQCLKLRSGSFQTPCNS